MIVIVVSGFSLPLRPGPVLKLVKINNLEFEHVHVLYSWPALVKLTKEWILYLLLVRRQPLLQLHPPSNPLTSPNSASLATPYREKASHLKSLIKGYRITSRLKPRSGMIQLCLFKFLYIRRGSDWLCDHLILDLQNLIIAQTVLL